MALTSKPRFYRFGTFQLDVQSGELRRNGVKLRLPGQSFQVLLRLLQHPGEVVTREDLHRELWPADTFVDFDEGLNAAVKKLRAALSDSAENPRFIETLPRRGYRFIAPVTRVEAEAAVAAAAAAAARPSFWRRPALWIAAGVLLAVGAAARFWPSRPAPAPIRSLAVLPLQDLSHDPQEEYFSEGLTDELITRLASLPGLRVISFATTKEYKDTRKPLPQIARELNVDAVVEGSVLRAGGRVRVTVQLAEAVTGRNLWAASYEREQQDIPALQNEVTRDIADNIQLNLDPASQKLLATAQAVDPRAHEDYLRGRYYWSQRSGSGMEAATRYFAQALAVDPNYARAYAGLADAYSMLGAYSWAPPGDFVPKARAAALKALELDPNLAEAHTSLAVIAQDYDWDWATAEREYRRAIELDPNYATAHHWYAEFLSLQGRFNEAFAEIERARQLDPLSLIIAADRGAILYYARQYDRSIEQFRAVLDRDPQFPRSSMIVYPYVEKGQFAQALAAIAQWQRPADDPWKLMFFVLVYARSGRRAEAESALRRLEQINRRQAIDPSPLLYAYIAMGRKEEAMAMFQRAYWDHSPSLINLKVNPFFDPLRSDPRFQELQRRMNLAQ